MVIYSLLQRSALLAEWEVIVHRAPRHFIGFGWDRSSIAAAEKRPLNRLSLLYRNVEGHFALSLQDALECFTPDQDAAALAQRAFNRAVKKTTRGEQPPPVPPKDYPVKHRASLEAIKEETESWMQFVQSITDDDELPGAGVTYFEEENPKRHGWLDTAL